MQYILNSKFNSFYFPINILEGFFDIRDWCKKKRTGLDLAMKMDAFSIV